jgi:hypothetical protein
MHFVIIDIYYGMKVFLGPMKKFLGFKKFVKDCASWALAFY